MGVLNKLEGRTNDGVKTLVEELAEWINITSTACHLLHDPIIM